jgi:hydrogenase maturation protein HypF
VPGKIRVPLTADETVLAVGGEMKSVVCLLKGNDAVLSEHLGELENPEAYRNFVNAIESLKKLLRLNPTVVVHDMHPDYSATRYAKQLNIKKMTVQHHHAHIVSCMSENSVSGKVIGVACDGTGYGTDGTIWGCEILTCDEVSFERSACLLPYPLIGGDYAARETWRPAAGIMHEAFGYNWRSFADFAFKRIQRERLDIAQNKLSSDKRIVMTSSLGRLFDAASFLLGICDFNRYEAEAAMSLETLASEAENIDILEYNIFKNEKGSYILDWRPMLKNIIEKKLSGSSTSTLARAFHATISAMLAEAVCRISGDTKLNRVALSGGCFANKILLESLQKELIKNHIRAYLHKKVPTGDGGIALGQAVIAAECVKRRSL